MTQITFNAGPSHTPPLACGCRGEGVYLVLKPEYRNVSRDGHGALHGQLVNYAQTASGEWLYTVTAEEADMAQPLPSLSGGMIARMCCQGCAGYAVEAFELQPIGARLVAAGTRLQTGQTFSFARLIRPFHVVDARAWIDEGVDGDVQLQLRLGAADCFYSGAPLTIARGNTSSRTTPWQWSPAVSRVLPEDGALSVHVVSAGVPSGDYYLNSGAKGLEIWLWGHWAPSGIIATT